MRLVIVITFRIPPPEYKLVGELAIASLTDS